LQFFHLSFSTENDSNAKVTKKNSWLTKESICLISIYAACLKIYFWQTLRAKNGKDYVG
jgi:hypothetical protein